MQKEIEQLRRKLQTGRSELFRNVDWKEPGRNLLEAHAALVDELMQEIYEISCIKADMEAPRTGRSGLAIVATGGYGRMELNPCSDVDIAFIPSEEEDPWVEALIHTAFKLVMDVFLSLRDIHVGYAFRPLSDAGTWDVTTKTSLLDLRLICGDAALAEKMSHAIREALSPLDLLLEFQDSGKSIWNHSDSIYDVEPNLKEGFGSLRDLHRARWIFRLLLNAENQDLEIALKECVGISEFQLSEIREAADWFWRARTWLHLSAGKLSDVLIVNYQDRIAQELSGCSSQAWLSRHFSYSEILLRFRKAAVRELAQGPLPVRGGLLLDGYLHMPIDLPETSSVVAMFHSAQHYDLPINLKDLKRLDKARGVALKTAEPSVEEVWAFNEILNESRGVAATMRALSEYGLLDRFIPNFSSIMRFAPPDPAHRNTVGEHSIRIIECLEQLRAGEDPDGRRFTDLLRQCTHFDMLCLAALIHDAGKLIPGNDHCESGAEFAKSVASRLKLPPEKSELLEILVRQHLLLVRTARLQDLKFANVSYKVAERIPSLEALQHIYVFTYADTSAVAEKSWTSMDFRDLEELYGKMQNHFARNTADALEDMAAEDRSVLIRKKIEALSARNDAAVMKHCQAMPSSYVLNTPLEEIAFHLQLLSRLESERFVLDVYNRPRDDYSELTLCTYDDDKPGMLSKIAGVLYGLNVDIHKAQAFTMENERCIILDTLWVRSNGMPLQESKARRMRSTLLGVLSEAQSVEEFLVKVGKNPPDGITLDAIDLRNDLSEEHTVVHIIAHDLQGLLYLMTRCLSRCGLIIHSAKIATFHARAENNFYVTAMDGGQISDSDLQAWTNRLEMELRGSSVHLNA
jgi:[protein-PII] uridylyltransferase